MHLGAGLKQGSAQRRADKPGGAGNKNAFPFDLGRVAHLIGHQ
jgi:hypothetical protein